MSAFAEATDSDATPRISSRTTPAPSLLEQKRRSSSRTKKATPATARDARFLGMDNDSGDDQPPSSLLPVLQPPPQSFKQRTTSLRSSASRLSSASSPRRRKSSHRQSTSSTDDHPKIHQSSPGDTNLAGQKPAGAMSALPQIPLGIIQNSAAQSKQEKDEPQSSNNPLVKALAESDWHTFLSLLEHIQTLPVEDILPAMAGYADDIDDSENHELNKASLLQTAVYKAPPALVMMLLELLHKGLGGQEELTEQLCCACDDDGNTALHLACANLDYIENDDKTRFLDTTVLQLLLLPSALEIQNVQGDTPLHLLMSSPMATACSSSTHTTEDSKNDPQQEEQLLMAAESAVDYVLEHESFSVEKALLQDCTGATPLHVAIAHGVHERLLQKLLSYAPKAASIPDSKGMLPLHYVAALSTQTLATFVWELVQAYPEALIHGSKYGDTPLHVFISNATEQMALDRNTFKVMELLMRDAPTPPADAPASPSSRGSNNSGTINTSPITAINCEHLNPLHCCAIFDAPPQFTRYLMKKKPAAEAAAVMTNTFGATPLHLAVAQPSVSTSLGNVMALGTKEAAGIPDRLKRTPLHVAAQNTLATEQLIQHLTELNSEATAMKTQRGHLPLHLAAQSQATEPVIYALIQAFPKAAEARNKSSNTPLHDAAKYRASVDVVKLLLDTYPDAVYVQNQYGNLPLHCATAYMSPPEVVQLLLNAWPDGASMQNRNQDAPLHYAAAYTTSVAAVKPLIDAAPAAVLLLNSSGQSPIDRAKANNAPEAIVTLLEESAEEWTKQASMDGWGSFEAVEGKNSF